jgi:hypothetical protein
MRLACRTHEIRNTTYKILVGKPEGKRPLMQPGYRWEDNIKMDVKKIRFKSLDWINKDRDRWLYLVDTVMNLQVP